MKDWRGNTNSMFKVLGASNHTDEARADRDFYATDPACMAALLEREDFCMDIWEPACGMGHLTKPLQMTGRAVRQSDIVDRQQNGEVEVKDFLLFNKEQWDGDIITNPPYAKALEFVEQALRCVADGHKVAMFLKIQFLEGKARRRLFDEYPPPTYLRLHRASEMREERRFRGLYGELRVLRMVRVGERKLWRHSSYRWI